MNISVDTCIGSPSFISKVLLCQITLQHLVQPPETVTFLHAIVLDLFPRCLCVCSATRQVQS